MARNGQTTDSRRMLVEMTKGRRSGYWVEILHSADDAEATAFALHTPFEINAGNARSMTWRDVPAIPTTWDGIRAKMARYEDDADAAERLPRYDEQRTYKGDIMPAHVVEAIMKHVKV